MSRVRTIAACCLVALALSACGGGIEASTCDEVVDVTIDLFQRLIDDVDAAAGDVVLADVVSGQADLPSIEQFKQDAERIDEIAEDLGCSRADVTAAVQGRLGELTADTDLGRFLVNAMRSGGLLGDGG